MQQRMHSCKNTCPESDNTASCPKRPIEYRSCDCGYVPPPDPGFCPQSTQAQGHKRKQGRFWWPKARPGTIVYLNCPFGPEGNFARRNCTLDKKSGKAVWEKPQLNDCEYSSEITKALDKLSIQMLPVTKHNAVLTMVKLENISTMYSGFQSIDVIMTSEILESVLRVRERMTEVGEDIIETVGMVMNVDIDVMNESQVEGFGPKRLVKVLDRYSEQVPLFEPSIKHVVPNLGFEALLVQPDTFQGASFSAARPSDPLKGLTADDVQTSTDTRGSDTAEASLILPMSLFNKDSFKNLPATREERLSFKVYQNGHLFPEMDLKAHNLTLNTRIISAAVKGQTISDLSDPVVTSFRALQAGDPDTAECKYWDFNANNGAGAWSGQGCRKVSQDNDVITCHCDHLTNFAILMELSTEGEPMAYEHKKALSIISYIGCAISLFALTITLITFIVFKDLRRTNPPRILINLCLALMFSLIVFIVGAERTDDVLICRIMAGLIHYFVLAAFLWMAVEAFNMYLCFVKIIPSRISMFILKCCLFAWGAPAIIVTVTMGLKFDHYGGKYYCRLKGIPFYGAFMVPSLTIILFNLVVFIMVLISLFTSRSNLTADKRTSGMCQARRAVAIMVLLGLTWVFGVMAISDAKLVFQYLFCIFNSLQGFFIFFFYCFRQENVRRKWKEFCCMHRRKKDSKKHRPRAQLQGGTKQSLERQEAFKHALSNNMYGSESVKHSNTGESDPPENLTLEQSRYLQTVTVDENSFKKTNQSGPTDETTSL